MFLDLAKVNYKNDNNGNYDINFDNFTYIIVNGKHSKNIVNMEMLKNYKNGLYYDMLFKNINGRDIFVSSNENIEYVKHYVIDQLNYYIYIATNVMIISRSFIDLVEYMKNEFETEIPRESFSMAKLNTQILENMLKTITNHRNKIDNIDTMLNKEIEIMKNRTTYLVDFLTVEGFEYIREGNDIENICEIAEQILESLKLIDKEEDKSIESEIKVLENKIDQCCKDIEKYSEEISLLQTKLISK